MKFFIASFSLFAFILGSCAEEVSVPKLTKTKSTSGTVDLVKASDFGCTITAQPTVIKEKTDVLLDLKLKGNNKYQSLVIDGVTLTSSSP